MFRKVLAILNKYSLYIIIALILISSAWPIIFWSCCDRERAISDKSQREFESIANKESKLEFYTIIPGPVYLNKEYGFSMNVPNGRYILEEKFSNSSADNILLVDEDFKDNFRSSFLDNNPGINGRDYFIMNVIPRESLDKPEFSYFKESIDELERMSKKGFVKKTEHPINGGKKAIFYLTSESNGDWPASLDKFLPEENALFEDESNIYYFSVINYFSDSAEGRMSHIKVMEEAIKSMKFVD
ncbi:MAG: hypothetical protein PHU56_03285 [Candidatus Pacebacteria bacterium]|nr:hypothetical protein [Candidatus Paceibacterota bacterium]